MQKKNPTQYLIPALSIAAFVIAFWPLLQKLQIRWGNGDNSYCYLIVPLFIYLCWEKKDRFRFGDFSWNLWGLIPVGLSILLMLAGELGSMETLLYLGIWGTITGVMAIFYGLRLRQLWFPLLILAFIVPLPPFVNRLLTFNLKLAASSLSVMMLRMAGVSVFLDGNIIDLGITQLQVVDACSGLRYLMPLILMALLFGYFYCRRWWQNTILLITVIPLSIVVNGLRIFVTGVLHVWGHPELAEDFFHDFSGWIVFMLAGAILFGLSLILRRLGGKPEDTPVQDPGGGSKPKAERSKGEDQHSTLKVKRFAVDGSQFTVITDPNLNTVPNDLNDKSGWGRSITITMILCLIFVGSGYALQNLPTADNLPTRTSFASFPMTIGDWQAKRNYLSQRILDNLWSDDYVSATYFNADRRQAIHLLIPFYDYQGTRHTAHAPQSCMLGGGWASVGSKPRLVTTAGDTRFPIMTTVWEKGDTRILGGYFFFQRGRVITSPWMNKYWLMVDAFTRQRTDGALVRAELVMHPGQSLDEAYAALEEFVGKVYAILPEFVPL